MTCVIVDDEPLAAELLASYARKTGFLELVGTYNSAIEAMSIIRNNPVDLMFLDIQMPELSGLEFATIIPSTTMIIFTTAFSTYAQESYKVNAIDYLLKPISYETFLASANKALKQMDIRKAYNNTRPEDNFIYVKSDHKLVKITISDILYIEGQKDYVKITLDKTRRTILCLMNMKTFEDFLPKPYFLRVHRSFIVNMAKSDGIDRMRIVFGDTYIPVSENAKDQVQQYVSQHLLS